MAGVALGDYRRFAWQAWDRWHWVACLVWFGRALVARDAAAFCVAGVALGDIHFRFAWQAWHKLTSTVVLRGRRGTDGTGWRAWSGLGAPWSRVTPRHSAWQAWHLVTFTFVLRGRRGTNSHLLSFCVAGVAQTQLYRRFAWQAWDRWHWVACLVWFGRALVARDAAAFCVAGVALGDIHFRFAWQAWHKLTSTVVLRGRRGTDGTGWRSWSGLGAPWSRVTPRHSAWQAWHLVTFTFVSRGRRGTNSHLPSFCVAGVGQMALVACLVWFGRALVARDAAAFCVAGVALGDIHFRSAWQAWRKLSSTVVLRGRRGTDGTGWRAWSGLGAPWSRVTPRHSAWQAWHLVTFTFVLRGRRGTNSALLSFCVAGVGQMALVACLVWFGRALVARDAAAFCVAGVALGDIHFRFARQAWHKLTSTVVLRGRRGTDGTGWRAWSGLGAPWSRVTPRHSAWQAWHLVTFTFVSRGTRGTNSHLLSFCVAGVAQTQLYRRFAWQAWDRWHWVACRQVSML